jgi:hypothetical protein
MEELEKEIEVCLGVGTNQIFPEIIKIKVPINFNPDHAWERVEEESNKQ